MLPSRRFAWIFTITGARFGADMVRYYFIATDSQRLQTHEGQKSEVEYSRPRY